MPNLTDRKLQTMKPGEWASDGGTRGAGTLAARKLPSKHVLFYFRYTNSQGRRDAVALGQWGSDARGLTLLAARDRAASLSMRYRNGDRDLREAIEAEAREAVRSREAQAQQAATQQARKKATLGALLSAYVAQLEKAGKSSKRAVQSAIERHVRDAWPVLWGTPADAVTTDDLISVVAKPAQDGKLREAAKLRSYLRAAYAAAIGARQSAQALPALRDLRITTNPARDIVTIQGASNSRDRNLSVAELRAYWKRISKSPDPGDAMLRFHLLTGGQRIEQLGRLTTTDRDPDAVAVLLRDSKGRRKAPRLHSVPLIPAAVDALEAMQGGTLGPYLFTITGGQSGAVYTTIQRRMRDVAAAMIEAGEAVSQFTPGDIRRTVETRLAALGVPAETRAQLQSHGLGGVQSRHYDRHQYAQEKRDALLQLFALVTGKPGIVTGITTKRAKGAARK